MLFNTLLSKNKDLHVAQHKKADYICTVFFMVLDLRLGRLEVGRLPSLF